MNISKYIPILNNSITLYVNQNGYITIDTMYNQLVYKLTLLYYWDRFTKLVSEDVLWGMCKSVSNSELFLFKSNGTQVSPPESIKYLIRLENEQNIINQLYNHNNPISSLVIFVVCIILGSFVTKYIFDLYNLQYSLIKGPMEWKE